MTIPNQAQIPKNCTFTENDAREMNTCIQKLLTLGSIIETNRTLCFQYIFCPKNRRRRTIQIYFKFGKTK